FGQVLPEGVREGDDEVALGVDLELEVAPGQRSLPVVGPGDRVPDRVEVAEVEDVRVDVVDDPGGAEVGDGAGRCGEPEGDLDGLAGPDVQRLVAHRLVEDLGVGDALARVHRD